MIDYKNVIFKEVHIKQLTVGANARIAIGTVSYPWSLKVLESTGAIGFYADALSGTARLYVNPDGSIIAGNATSTGSTSIANVGTLDGRYATLATANTWSLLQTFSKGINTKGITTIDYDSDVTHTSLSMINNKTTNQIWTVRINETSKSLEVLRSTQSSTPTFYFLNDGSITIPGTTRIQNIIFSGSNEMSSSSGFFMQYNTNGDINCNGGSSTGNLISNNFTKLGSDAPKIKMKKVTGTTGSTDGATVNIAHGLTGSKIISIAVLVTDASNNRYSPECTEANKNYRSWFDNTNVVVKVGGTDIRGRPITVLLTYEE
jgi:hypothetical protein